VDVGHYNANPGVISASGRPEFEYNLDLALEVRDVLLASGHQVRMIGERGDYAELHHRTRDARGTNLFVSIHHDSVKERLLPQADRFAGFSLFISRSNPELRKSLACASAIGEEMRAAGMTPSRYHADPVIGENRPFADERNGVHFYDNLGVGKTAKMASVLVEAGVIINGAEEARMNDAALRTGIADAIARGVKRCLP